MEITASLIKDLPQYKNNACAVKSVPLCEVSFFVLKLTCSLVKSCSVMGDAVPALGPPWVNSCICSVSLVRWSDHSSLYNGTEMVTAAWQGIDGYRQEMTQV